MYHSVPRHGTTDDGMNAVVFESHIKHLKRYFTFIRAEDFGKNHGSLLRPPILLSFDDGLRNHAEVAAPILRRYQVPAVFFVSSRHCSPGRYLWFTYLKMLDRHFHGELKFNGTSIQFGSSKPGESFERTLQAIEAMTPYPEAMYTALSEAMPAPLEELVSATVLRDECEGMTPDQLREMANDPLFTIGAHTCDHPALPRCTPQEAERQIAENKAWLEATTGVACDLLAYPHGAFTQPIAEICRKLGFRFAFADRSQVAETDMNISRVGVYKPSAAVLHMKILCGGGVRESWPVRRLRTLHPQTGESSEWLRNPMHVRSAQMTGATRRQDGSAND